jgi:nitroreductase/NAD-dependent dihydropyrimidine dehydrogenase PreA subunit
MMIKIDQHLCIACGICGEICPRRIPETIMKNKKKTTVISPERLNLCMACGHCSAICPNGAIQVEQLPLDNFSPVEKNNIKNEQLLTFLKQRRSVRRYNKKPVPREIINRIVEAAHTAPTGTGSMTTGVIIIDNPEILAKFSRFVYQGYETLVKVLNNPIARFIIKRKKGKMILKTLQDFVMPGMRWYIRWYREGKSNEILRDCPVLLLFHSPVLEPMAPSNCLVAAYNTSLMSQAMDVGTCFNDLIPPMCNRLSEIRRLLKLPADREVYASLIMGYPKFKFKRVIPRRLAEVRYLK